MTPQINHKQIDVEGQATIQEMLQEKLRLAIKLTIIQVLEEEVKAFMTLLQKGHFKLIDRHIHGFN